MSNISIRQIDKNRFGKRYPFVRAPARVTLQVSQDFDLEMGSIYFDNTDTGTLTFEVPFPDTNFAIAATVRDNITDTGNVNIFVSAVTVSSVTIQASSNFTGYVDVFASRIM